MSFHHQASVSSCCACCLIHLVLLWGAQVLRFAGGHPPLLHQPKVSLFLGTLGCGNQEGEGIQGPLLVWTNQMGCLVPLHFPRLAGRALQCQHPSWGYFQAMTELRLPTILIEKDWVTGVTFEQGPHGATSPGGLWFDDLESGIFAGSCLSTCGFWSSSDCD